MSDSVKTILKSKSKPSSISFGKRSRVDGDTILEITFFLKPASQHVLHNHDYFYDISNKSNPIVSRRKFNQLHQAHLDGIDLLTVFASSNHLKVLRKNELERWMVLSGKVRDIEKALEIDIKAVSFEEKQFFYHLEDATLPKDFGDYIASVSGLNTLPVRISNIFPDERAFDQSVMDGTGVKPQDFEKLYNFPKGLDGSGQTIAIISLGGGYRKKVLKKYFSDMGIPMPDISWKGVNGAKNCPDDQPKYVRETNMDIQVAGSLAPGAKIVVYFAGNDLSNIPIALKKAIHETRKKPTIVSISWGKKEDVFSVGDKQTLDQILLEAASLNITVLASSGDYGSKGGFEDPDTALNVQLPAAHPLVLSIGGTEIHEQDGVIIDEHAWDDLFLDVLSQQSGGGFSKDWSMPKYQFGNVPDSINHNGKRGIPDVAANASSCPGIIFYTSKAKQISSGTSASTPLWAALIARINQHLNENGIRNLGFANPIFYHEDVASTFNPVDKGDNGAYKAGVGWDACTGLGTPQGTELMEAIHSLKVKLGVGKK